MGATDWAELIDRLRGVEFGPGLSGAEVASAESRYGFVFPPDLREFLQTALPQGPKFPDWRAGAEAELRGWLAAPLDGILFDVEFAGFWLAEWGPRPASLAEATEVVAALIAAAPKLIPVFMHRMMPDAPHESGNPVFSVHQADIIHYGRDLADYLVREFLTPVGQPIAWDMGTVRPIPFWDVNRLYDANCGEQLAPFGVWTGWQTN